MELLKEGEDFPFQTADAAQSDLDLDEVTLAAKNAFGIKYLFAWQRIVIANILDSALGLPEDTPLLQTDDSFGEDDVASLTAADDSILLQTDASVGEDDIALQTGAAVEEECTASQTATAVEEDDTALQTDAPSEEDVTTSQTTTTAEDNTALQTNAPVGKADIALQTDAATTEEEESLFYRGRQIVLLPTGAGKSLCFLTPALLLKGPTLVIYPLLALMADQKRRMDSGGIESVIFRGGQSPQEREENFAKIKKGAKIIIANPEVLQNKSIVKELAACKIQHIAIDEAHCVSEWGDSFRPAYLTLGKIIEELDCKTVTAFTATASPQVLDRVSQVLFGGQSHIVRSDADRSNIRYNVIYAAAKKRLAFRLAVTEQKPLLIFCGTRAKSEDMARELALYMGCDKVKFYHAGLEKAEKTATEEWFFNKSDAVLCCTCAYGMGVDKKDIKTVIHLESPPTAESYLQESGRIARDGSIGKAILLWNYADHKKFSAYPKNSREYKMLLFAESSTCRRQVLLDALGAEQAVCSGCDVCERGGKAPFAYDLDLALSFITKNRKMYGYSQTQALLQSEFNKKDLALFGLRIWDQEDILTILSELKSRKLIKKCRWPWKGRLTNVKCVNTDKKRIQHKKKERPVTEAHLKIRRSFMFNRRKLVNKIIGKKKA
ncbi:MAG: ATP-dependent DNA helicase RecQ [Treponema sp.]|nr:ATP-dependent DNA helicase RecQ [Treponema sp.]